MSYNMRGKITAVPECPVCETNEEVRESMSQWKCSDCQYSWSVHE